MTKAKFEISDFVDPVDPVATERVRGVFRERLETMPVGKAIIVGGMTRNNAASRASMISKQCEPKRKFSTAALPDGRIQISRIA